MNNNYPDHNQKIKGSLSLLLLFAVGCFGADFIEAAAPPQTNNKKNNENLPLSLKGLEKEFCTLFEQDICFDSPDLLHHLEPNERGVIAVQDHLKIERSGLLISVGTERSLFDLILCAQCAGKFCLGLVVRDIDPKVKAYLDFAILLLRLSANKNDFQYLTQFPHCSYESAIPEDEYQQFLNGKLIEIRNRLDSNDLPLLINSYYLKNLEILFSTYMERRRFWELEYPEGFLNYHEDDELFAILQTYAKNGNILTTIGNINDLHFLGDKQIGVIDISNIPDFSMLDLQHNHLEFEPRIVWTKITPQPLDNTWARYYSFIYHSLFKEERDEINTLLIKMAHSYHHPRKKFSYRMITFFIKKWNPDSLEPDCFPSYSRQFLLVLRNYFNERGNL